VRLLKFFFALQPLHMMLAILAGALSGVGNIVFIATVNTALHPRPGSIAVRATILTALCIGVVLLRFSSDVILIRLFEKVVYHLRTRLSAEILTVPLRRIEVLGPHSLFATLTEDVGRLADLALNIPNVCVNAAIVIAGMLYLFFLSRRVMLIVMLVITVGVVVYSLIRLRAIRHFQRARERQGELMKHFRALTDGVKEMKLNRTRESQFTSRLQGTTRDLQQELVTGNTTFMLGLSWAQLTFFGLIAVVLLFASQLGAYGLAPAVLSGTVLALLCIRVPMETIVGMFVGFTRAQVSLNKIDQLGLSLSAETETAVEQPQEIVNSMHPVLTIEMRGVTHSYRSEADSFTLGPLDFCFRAGEMIFVSGGNGSGKTTFLKLLTGLYVPESGYLECNDVRVTGLNRANYRSTFSAVFSDFHLSDTIARPVSSDLDQIAADYLREFRLDHKVTVKNGVFSTIALSQGQRKRLALIAAILEDKPMYVFDEWAADQDVSFRQKFYHRILPELKRKGKTLFVISHDQHYFEFADRLIVLEEGRLWKDTANGEQLNQVVSEMQALSARGEKSKAEIR
jgi:putative ATP-binding cassette transporter